jgi:translation initiation factor 1
MFPECKYNLCTLFNQKNRTVSLIKQHLKINLLSFTTSLFQFLINRYIMSNNRLVYSTETGRIDQPKPVKEITNKLFKDGSVHIERQTKGRKGKGVMLVVGIDSQAHDLKKLAKSIKSKMGQGGAVKEGVIEVQGDDRDKLKAILEGLKFKVKIAGG